MAEGGSARARAEELWERAAAERAKEDAARTLAESLEAQAGAWDAGAEGERRVAEALRRLPDGWHVLHDRLLRPGTSRANIDHVVVGPAGVFLVDAKNWAGGTSVHDGNLWQHAARSGAKGPELDKLSSFAGEMEKALGVPVVPVIALAGGHGSRFRAQRVRGVEIVPCARLANWLRGQPGGTDAITVDLLSRKVAHTYPSASPEDTAIITTAGSRPMTVRDVVASARPAVPHTGRRAPSARTRRRRSRRRQSSMALALVGLVALLGFGFVGPRVDPLIDPGRPGAPFASNVSPSEAPSTPDKACHALTTAMIQQVTGSKNVLEAPRAADDVCTWWLATPRYASQRADVILEMGRTVRVRFAATGTTGSRIDLLPGEVSAWLPQNTSLSGWKAKTKVSQPFMISLRFAYPDGAGAKQVRAAEMAAERKVTRLAEELARSLATRPGP